MIELDQKYDPSASWRDVERLALISRLTGHAIENIDDSAETKELLEVIAQVSNWPSASLEVIRDEVLQHCTFVGGDDVQVWSVQTCAIDDPGVFLKFAELIWVHSDKQVCLRPWKQYLMDDPWISGRSLYGDGKVFGKDIDHYVKLATEKKWYEALTTFSLEVLLGIEKSELGRCVDAVKLDVRTFGLRVLREEELEKWRDHAYFQD